MKKLICLLLILCLCLSGATAGAKGRSSSKGSEKSARAEKSDKTYSYNAGDRTPLMLSDILKGAGIDVKVGKVKSVELADGGYAQKLIWEKDGKDYRFTALETIKKVSLRVRTKSDEYVIQLKNVGRTPDPEEAPGDTAREVAGAEMAEPPAEDGAADPPPVGAEPMEEGRSAEAGPLSKAPADAGEAPSGTDEALAGTGEAPAATDEASADTGEAPAGTGEAPAGTGEAPAATDQAPAATGEAPAGTGEAPAATDQAPAATDQAPAATDQAPAAVGEAPAGTGEAPAATDQAPADAGEAPADTGEAPAGQPESPETGEAGAQSAEAQGSEAQSPEGQDSEAPSGAEAEVSGEAQSPEGENAEAGEGDEAPAADGEGADEGSDPRPAGEGGDAPEAQAEGEPQDAAKPPEDGDASAEATPVPELSDDAEAWFERDGYRLGGTLEQTVALLNGNEKVYIRAAKPLLLKGAPLRLLSGVTLLPDRDVYAGGDYAVRVSTDDPAGAEPPELIGLERYSNAGAEETGDLYFWVADLKQEAEPAPTPSPQISVKARNFEPASWTSAFPEFELSGIPEDKSWSYAAIIYDERIIPMSDSVYVPEAEGVYTLRFAMLDEIGDIMSASEQYTLWLDCTPPEQVFIEVDEEVDYRLHITASDAISGVQAVSLNGGAKWHRLANDDTYTYTGKEKRVFAPGEILIRDVAGNIYESDAEYTVDRLEPEEGGGGYGGGGGGGGGSGSAPKSHASGDGEEGAEYDAVTLDLPEEPMRQLTVGGEPLELTLWLGNAEQPGAPVGEGQRFTASLCNWYSAEDERDGGAPDTLLLDAESDGDLGDRFTYEWRFNGGVYRLLSNSGIRYVALKVGDAVAAFPTEGFTGGTKYTELKMLGVSTRKFDYTLAMKVDLNPGYVSEMSDFDFSRECDLSIRAEVENMAYELSSSTGSIMYFYNVYLGPADMLNRPFGEYGN